MSLPEEVRPSNLEMFPDVVRPIVDDTDERYTVEACVAECLRLTRTRCIDLDVAACEEAHIGGRYFTRDDNGLSRPWDGGVVWCNPPWSDIEPWVVKAWAEMKRDLGPERILMLLPAWTDRAWWQTLVEPARDRPGNFFTTHFLRRYPFGSPGNREAVGVDQPHFWCVLLVWGRS